MIVYVKLRATYIFVLYHKRVQVVLQKYKSQLDVNQYISTIFQYRARERLTIYISANS